MRILCGPTKPNQPTMTVMCVFALAQIDEEHRDLLAMLRINSMRDVNGCSYMGQGALADGAFSINV